MRVALVTGGSRGIGRGIVRELAGRGWAVAINYRQDRPAAEEARAEALALGSPRAEIIAADVSEIEQCRQLVARAREMFGRLDLLVSNAGVAPRVRRDLLEADGEEWSRALDTNLRGPFFLAQAAANAMIADLKAGLIETPQIHFIGSVSAEMASVNRGEYCVAKAGLGMVARAFAVRLAGEGIRVFEIRPGIIATDMTAGVKEVYDRKIADGLIPIPRWGEPKDVGKAVASLAEGGIPYATGSVIYVDGGLHLPRL
jgi:3-oxoacyl-[acyl-carrier protein] reductase